MGVLAYFVSRLFPPISVIPAHAGIWRRGQLFTISPELNRTGDSREHGPDPLFANSRKGLEEARSGVFERVSAVALVAERLVDAGAGKDWEGRIDVDRAALEAPPRACSEKIFFIGT